MTRGLSQELGPNYSPAGRERGEKSPPPQLSISAVDSLWPTPARGREQGSLGVQPVEASSPGHGVGLGSKWRITSTHILSWKRSITSPFYSWTN